MDIIRCMFTTAIKDWGYRLDNPLDKLRLPKFNNSRDRVLSGEEFDVITKTDYPIRLFIILLMETAMRRGECLQLKPEYVDLKNNLLTLPKEITKNGFQRIIPLTEKARAILGNCLPWKTPSGLPYTISFVRRHWEKLMRDNGFKNLNIHDLRHFALTQFGEMGLNPMQLQIISGHRDLRLLMRYCHMKAQNILKDNKFQSTTLLGKA